MNTLQDFFENAKVKNLCDRGAKIWEHCGSKKALMDFALGGWGCDYVATAIAQGWGISPEAVAADFAPFNNGKYTRDKDGYTSQMYCLPDDSEITINSTLTLIIGFKGVINIARPICELYICKSEVTINGNGRGVAYLYDSVIDNPDTAPVVVKEDKRYGEI